MILLGLSLFFIGLLGTMANRSSLIKQLLCIEISMLGASLNFVYFSIIKGDAFGIVFALVVIMISALEMVLGLSLVLSFFIRHGTVDVEKLVGGRQEE